jgi:hypothetical protein
MYCTQNLPYQAQLGGLHPGANPSALLHSKGNRQLGESGHMLPPHTQRQLSKDIVKLLILQLESIAIINLVYGRQHILTCEMILH